jgi:hypothetical protein
MGRIKGSKNKPKEAPGIPSVPAMPSPQNPNTQVPMSETQLRQKQRFPGFFTPEGKPL